MNNIIQQYFVNLLSNNNYRISNKEYDLFEVKNAYNLLFNHYLEFTDFSVPNFPEDKGIVIGVGGAKYFGCAFACIYILRKLGCRLPIEFWYLDEYEIDNNMKNICDLYNIQYINAKQYCKQNNLSPRILNGWELKPFSVLHSQFKEVLYLDADNIPVKNPTYLFYTKEYLELGSIFWPDLPVCKTLHPHRTEWVPPEVWEMLGMKYMNEPDFETGQFMINKEKCFKELSLTMFLNEHSDWIYRFVYGDKSTFHLAWRKCGSDYAIPQKPAGWSHPCILQHDFEGSLIFQHAAQGKEMIFNGNFPKYLLCHEYVKEAKLERDKYWDGNIFSWKYMTDEEKLAAGKIVGKYLYTRISLDSRVLELLDNGIVGEGKDKCERRWSVRIIDGVANIILIGAFHKDSEIAMFFAKDYDGTLKSFNGQWTAFEKCYINLTKLTT